MSEDSDLPGEARPEQAQTADEGADEAGAAPSEQPAELDASQAADAADAGEGDDAMSPEEIRSALESLVFVSDRVITATQLARALKMRTAEVKPHLAWLCEAYADRGVQLVEVGGGYQFRSSPDNARFVQGHVAQRPVRLTRAQLETLALVAYRQPITRPEIDEVRGVDTGSAVKVLLERGLIKMIGRKDEPGRPLLYGTTPFFLEFFGLRALKDLPTLREFTELSEESRVLFKRKTGETAEEAEQALAEQAAAAEQPQDAEGEQDDESTPTQGEGDERGPVDAESAVESTDESTDGHPEGDDHDADDEPGDEGDDGQDGQDDDRAEDDEDDEDDEGEVSEDTDRSDSPGP